MIVLYGDEVRLLLDNEMATIDNPVAVIEGLIDVIDGDYDNRYEYKLEDYGYMTFCKDVIILETEINRRVHYGAWTVYTELRKLLKDLELVINRMENV
jgi:hypothetical protein